MRFGTLLKRNTYDGDYMNNEKPMKDYDVIITIGAFGIDESDVENQLDWLLSQLDYDELNYKIEFKEQGTFL